MATRLKIGLDVDGVLANFIYKYKWAAEELGLAYQDGIWDLGLNAEEVDLCWKLIKSTPDFWQTVPPYEDLEFLAEKDSQHELCFITARVPTEGSPVNWQTAWWLEDHLGITLPTVLVVANWRDKPALIKALKLDAFLDDKMESVENMVYSHGLNALLLDQPWNASADVNRVYSVSEFFEKVEAQFIAKQGL